MQQVDIFIAFFRSGILGFGGGPSAIPLVQREVVHVYQWMSDEEFGDIFALANALPGPINTKLAGYIGYRVGGILGLFTALIATVLPTVVMMIVFLALLATNKDKPWVAGMTHGVLPVVGVLMGILTWEFVKKSKLTLGWKWTIILFVLSLLVMEVFGVHPALVILTLLGAALLSRNQDKGHERGKP